MLLPLGTDRQRRRRPVMTPAIIAVTLVSQMAVYAAGSAYTEALLLDTQNPTATGWVTYAFLHADLWHILGNMLFLWVFGQDVEDRLGRFGFLLFYLVAAAVSAWAFAAFDGGGRLIGASGAVSGVTGAFLVLFPRVPVRVFLIMILIGVFMIPAWWFIAFRVGLDLFGFGLRSGSRVAYSAHLGGYAYGAGVALALLWLKVVPRAPYDLLSLAKQRARRREFARAAEVAAERRERIARAPDEPPATDDPDPAALAARARVSEAARSGDEPAIAAAYVALLRAHGGDPGATTLGRDTQLAAGNALFAQGDHTSASKAYERYLDAYPSASDAPRVRLLLGLVLARYLNDPVAARAQLERARAGSRTADDRHLAETLLEELG